MNINYAQIAAAAYQTCITYDQYLPPLSPDLARSWGRVFEAHSFKAEHVIDGVHALYAEKGNGYRPLPADIAQAASAVRRNQNMSESREEREARQEALSAKAKVDPEIAQLAERLSLPVEPKYKRGGPNSPKSIACPWCKAQTGQPCVEPSSGKPLTRTPYHPARTEAWAGKTA